ncbi:MAG: hypothetical protein WC926_03100 [Candidatus Paceibacterota bacterium]|jgi:hypothetical protein
MPKELDAKRLSQTRDELAKLAMIADSEGFESFGEKISSIAQEAGRMVEEQTLAASTEQYVSA